MTDKEAMKRALDAFEDTHYRIISAGLLDQDLLNRNFTVATALRERLAQPAPVQEPVAEIVSDVNGHLSTRWSDEWTPDDGDKLYTHPPQRTWIDLTEEQMMDCDIDEDGFVNARSQAKLNVQAKLKEKNFD
jgi:hypothetical protein